MYTHTHTHTHIHTYTHTHTHACVVTGKPRREKCLLEHFIYVVMRKPRFALCFVCLCVYVHRHAFSAKVGVRPMVCTTPHTNDFAHL